MTVNAQCVNVVALENALCALDAHMKLAEVVRRSRVYLLSKNVDQIALLQCLEKLHADGILQVMRAFDLKTLANQLMSSFCSDSALVSLLSEKSTCE